MNMSTPLPKIKTALLSVSDKDGLVPFAKGLAALDIKLLSTGGTAKTLREAGLQVTDVSDHTGFPEMMDGRVKTLHPKIHGGLLARRDVAEHVASMDEHDIACIDLVVVNLYPFVQTLESGADFQTCVENIDIGGPAMLRSAAKNFDFVGVVTNPADYGAVLSEIQDNDGALSQATRMRLSALTYTHTAAYDAAISAWLSGEVAKSSKHEAYTPPVRAFAGRLKQTLRYGENPHQTAALYADASKRPGVATATQVQGKELSYNNLNDTDAAFELVAEFEEPAVAIIKHANPCGVATAESCLEAYKLALRCDPTSAFGGIIALNRTLDGETAAEIIKVFSEVIIAPSITAEAIEILKSKANVRVLTTGEMPDPLETRDIVKSIAGGLLVQSADSGRVNEEDLKVVSDREPTPEEMDDLLFAFRVAKHVKSNTIVYVKDGATVGIGAGQMSRIDAAKIAASKMAEAGLSGCKPVVASDAFFPFADGLIAAADAGVTAVIQPGGSIRDQEVIEAANDRGLAMVLTGMRHFKH
ncbi:MAG: bifunctional phosphoribosylaminoimidazolecarboxamide formyltransferase/IMP cyclohydrolase [Pseudobdellovibrionaceae bacterium]